jgi:hypothetical protein
MEDPNLNGYCANPPKILDDGSQPSAEAAAEVPMAAPQAAPPKVMPAVRELLGHIVNEVNDKLRIRVLDEPGSGGAHHLYVISGFDPDRNPSEKHLQECEPFGVPVLFQNGPISEVGVNGITHEALLAILIDRLGMFQAGPFACFENGVALDCLRQAQNALLLRTRKRMERGVEGTHEV